MAFFDEVFSRLFGRKTPGPAPLVHEPLTRSEGHEEGMASWLAAGGHQDMIEQVSDAYHKKKLGIVSQPEVHLLNSPYSNGFAISYQDEMGRQPFLYLFDYLKDSTLELDYKLSQADRKIMDKGEHEETVEKWYLKPIGKSGKDFADQLYGNVLIEHVAINRKPSYLKLMVNVYQGRPYSQALSFDEFLEKLFNPI